MLPALEDMVARGRGRIAASLCQLPKRDVCTNVWVFTRYQCASSRNRAGTTETAVGTAPGTVVNYTGTVNFYILSFEK